MEASSDSIIKNDFFRSLYRQRFSDYDIGICKGNSWLIEIRPFSSLPSLFGIESYTHQLRNVLLGQSFEAN